MERFYAFDDANYPTEKYLWPTSDRVRKLSLPALHLIMLVNIKHLSLKRKMSHREVNGYIYQLFDHVYKKIVLDYDECPRSGVNQTAECFW